MMLMVYFSAYIFRILAYYFVQNVGSERHLKQVQVYTSVQVATTNGIRLVKYQQSISPPVSALTGITLNKHTFPAFPRENLSDAMNTHCRLPLYDLRINVRPISQFPTRVFKSCFFFNHLQYRHRLMQGKKVLYQGTRKSLFILLMNIFSSFFLLFSQGNLFLTSKYM